jgi:hypothetical protein
VTKCCYKCGEFKSLESFAINRSKSDGRANMCRSCKKVYNATYYGDTKERHNPSRAERRKRERAEVTHRLIEYLQRHPCVDCGETDIVVLDFDHQRDKTMDIHRMRGYSWSRVAAEIEKCEVVCANDHRRRTAAAQRWARAQVGNLAPSAQLVELPTLHR